MYLAAANVQACDDLRHRIRINDVTKFGKNVWFAATNLGPD
jgi:hypothetical protein